MNIPDFCHLSKGHYVVWKPTNECGTVQSRRGVTMWVRWRASGKVEKLDAIDDAYHLEAMPHDVRAKLARTYRMASARMDACIHVPPDIETPEEQEEILGRIAALRAAKRAAEGGKVLLDDSYDEVSEDE